MDASSHFYAELLAPFAEHKNISAYWERLKERESVQKYSIGRETNNRRIHEEERSLKNAA
jgi:hypothetical protein